MTLLYPLIGIGSGSREFQASNCYGDCYPPGPSGFLSIERSTKEAAARRFAQFPRVP